MRRVSLTLLLRGLGSAMLSSPWWTEIPPTPWVKINLLWSFWIHSILASGCVPLAIYTFCISLSNGLCWSEFDDVPSLSSLQFNLVFPPIETHLGQSYSLKRCLLYSNSMISGFFKVQINLNQTSNSYSNKPSPHPTSGCTQTLERAVRNTQWVVQLALLSLGLNQQEARRGRPQWHLAGLMLRLLSCWIPLGLCTHSMWKAFFMASSLTLWLSSPIHLPNLSFYSYPSLLE